MSKHLSLITQIPQVSLLPPAADASGRTSAYVSFKNIQKAWVVVHVNQGNVAPVTLTLTQAKDVSGTGAKAINAVPIWLVADTSTSDAYAAQTAAASFATSATTKDKIVVFEILPEAALDVTNGFKALAITTSASNAANITEARIQYEPAFQQTTPLSILVN